MASSSKSYEKIDKGSALVKSDIHTQVEDSVWHQKRHHISERICEIIESQVEDPVWDLLRQLRFSVRDGMLEK